MMGNIFRLALAALLAASLPAAAAEALVKERRSKALQADGRRLF